MLHILWSGRTSCYVNPDRLAEYRAHELGITTLSLLSNGAVEQLDLRDGDELIILADDPSDPSDLAHEFVHARRYHEGHWSARHYRSALAALVEEYHALREGNRLACGDALHRAFRAVLAQRIPLLGMLLAHKRATAEG